MAGSTQYTRHWWLYTLELESGMYYVGITTNIERRFTQHSNGMGSKFTRLYAPVGIISSKYIGFVPMSEAAKYEDAATAELIKIVGIDKCCGGSFLNPRSKKKLQRKYDRLSADYKYFQGALPIVKAQPRVKRVKRTRKSSPWGNQVKLARKQLSESTKLL